MNRRLAGLMVVALLVAAGCNSSSAPEGTATTAAPAATTTAAPLPAGAQAVQVATEFLDAVVKGDTARASSLLTPLAVERIAASGKPFQLPGMTSFTFRIGEVRQPTPEVALVQCMGKDQTAGPEAAEEEFCWLMSPVEGQWRIAALSFTYGPQKTQMIFSFENPEKGPMPVQKLMNPQPAGQLATTPTAPATMQPAGVPQQTPTTPAQQPPYTAQEVMPAAGYR